jgi:hypothetical protein
VFLFPFGDRRNQILAEIFPS